MQSLNARLLIMSRESSIFDIDNLFLTGQKRELVECVNWHDTFKIGKKEK